MWRFLECEPPAEKPLEWDEWWIEIGEVADAHGEAATVGVVLQYAPLECVQYLASQQPMFAELLSRARFADARRFQAGVLRGRQLLYDRRA